MTSQWPLCRGEVSVNTVAGSRTWTPGASRALQATLLRVEKGSKYGAHLIDLQRRFGNFIQTYACRSIRGGGAHSEHSHPVAFDVWPGANPMSDRGILITNFAMFGAADGEKFLHSIMDPPPGMGRGIWQWGGGLYSDSVQTAIACFRRRGHDISSGRVDAMHFELSDWVTSSFVNSYDWGRWTGSLGNLLVPYPGHPLKHGSRSPAVVTWKHRLRHHFGLWGFVVRYERFGIGTVRATKKFQRQHHLRVDGVVGPQTWAAAFKI